MGWCDVVLTESSRRRLAVVLALWHSMLALTALAFIGLGVYIKLSVENYAIILEGHYGGTLPNMLIAVGFLLFIVHAAGVKLSVYCLSWQQRADIHMALLPYGVLLFVAMWVTMATFALSFQHRTHLEDSFEKGLSQAMRRYNDMHSVSVKQQIDTLQMGYGCCGSESYEEWLTIPWINTHHVNMESPLVKRYDEGCIVALSSDRLGHVDYTHASQLRDFNRGLVYLSL